MTAGVARQSFHLRNLRGALFTFDDVALMTRACGRITQVMVFGGRAFTLEEAVGGRTIEGATILKADVDEFRRLFPLTEMSEDEMFMLGQIGDDDFAISVHAPDMNAGLLCHELSHVLFYYDEGHRNAITEAWYALNDMPRFMLTERLRASGYEDVELIDEWFAHLLYGFARRERGLCETPALSRYVEKIREEFLRLVAVCDP